MVPIARFGTSFVLFGYLMTLANVGAAETISMTGVFPASSTETAKLSRLAVRPFGGTAGFLFSRSIQSALNTPDIGRMPYFILVVAGDRTVRADAVIDGSGSASSTDQRFTQTVSDCTQYSGIKCVAANTRNVQCVNRIIDASFDLRIVRTGSGEILYSAHKPLQDQSIWCEGQVAAATVNQIVSTLAAQAAEQIRLEITPHSQAYSVRVMETTKGISKPHIRAFKDLIRLSTNDIADSCQGWKTLATQEPDSASIAYDMGICQENEQAYADAENSYRKAQIMFGDGKKEVAASITRANQLAQVHAQVMQQLASRKPANSMTLLKRARRKR